ncbi:SDR family oxidoreductase, partial [Salmonella enterica subsp. enterica serovar Senftenberg]|nr:SDR family oxidoreductase [Salmonella enterica subsp. enterica serovar Senftenberg]
MSAEVPPDRDAGRPVAVVTGASRGIGRHLADALEHAGYVVERGSSAVADVTDRVAVGRWVADVVDRHGRIDVLVNNAGVIDTEVPIHEADPDEWWRTMEVNVLGPFLVTHAVLPHMIAAGTGRVLNLNSGAG